MSWNPIVDWFNAVRIKYENKYGKVSMWDYADTTCIEHWVNEVGSSYDKLILDGLDVKEYDKMILFHYTKFFYNKYGENYWDLYGGIFRYARGLALNKYSGRILLAPFDKFFNINERPETAEDVVYERIKTANSVEFSNKLDGSMISISHDGEGFYFASSNSLNPDECSQLKAAESWFYNRAEYVVMVLNNHMPFTYIFEWIDVDDPHVVSYSHKDYGLHLIGCRNNETGETMSYEFLHYLAYKHHVKTTEIFNTTLDNIMDSLDAKTANEAEGFVVDIDGFKVKIKYNDYVKMHRISDRKALPNIVLEHIHNDTIDDFMSKLTDGEIKNRAINYMLSIEGYLRWMDDKTQSYYELIMAQVTSKKEFMILVDKVVPQMLRGYVRNIFLHRPNDFLKGKTYTNIIEELKKNEQFI